MDYETIVRRVQAADPARTEAGIEADLDWLVEQGFLEREQEADPTPSDAHLLPCDDYIRGFAELAIHVARVNGFSDADILAYYTSPNPVADARMEAAQVAERGSVYAPAAAVKERMRLLLAMAA